MDVDIHLLHETMKNELSEAGALCLLSHDITGDHTK